MEQAGVGLCYDGVMIAVNTELYCLVGLATLCVPLAHLPAIARILKVGAAWGVGNRDQDLPGLPAWIGRADRAHKNLVENIAFYCAALFAVLITGRCDGVTHVAALTLVGARLCHAALYIGGVTFLGLRSGAYFVALASTLTLLSRLL